MTAVDSETRKQRFLQLSSALCGVAIDSSSSGRSRPGDLMPASSPIDRSAEFLAALDEEIGGIYVDALLERFAAGGAAALMGNPPDAELCGCVMKMWFLGSWIPPASQPAAAAYVVSTQAYKEALVWKIMQSHPMGYSAWTFGYWEEDPPPLAEFLTLNDEGPAR